MLHRMLLASAGALALSGTALAADLTPAPPPVYVPPPPPPSWTGFTIGVNAGGTWSSSNAVNIVTATAFTDPTLSDFGLSYPLLSAAGTTGNIPFNSGGFIGGAQVPLLHVAVAGAEVAQDRTHLRDIGLGFIRRPQIGLRNDLHQRDA